MMTPASPDCRYKLTKPFIIGYMSTDVYRTYNSNLSQLKFLPSIPDGNLAFDLNHNIDIAIKRTTDQNGEKINLLLKFLLDPNFRQILKDNTKENMFITYRRTLISVMCCAFEKSETIRIIATLYKGSIYLCSLETPHDKKRREGRSKQEKIYCAWGYKFEQYLLSDHPKLQPNIDKPVIENEEFSMYYTSTLGNHHLLYGAQIDALSAISGIVPDPPTDCSDVETNLNFLRNSEFIELKTNAEIQNYRQDNNFRKHKLLRCWCQCYLADLKGLLVGFRNGNGVIQRVQYFSTIDLENYCKDEWNPEKALSYLNSFLSFVQNVMKKLVVNSRDSISREFYIENKKFMSREDPIDTNILPDWYINGEGK